MKKFISTSGFLLLVFVSVMAQDIPQRAVPAVVLNSFQQAFPKASHVEWEKKRGGYEAEFESGIARRDHKVQLAEDGSIILHEEEISSSALPQSVRDAIRREFKGFRLDDAKKITEKGKVTYKVSVENRTEEWKLLLSDKGEMLQKKFD